MLLPTTQIKLNRNFSNKNQTAMNAILFPLYQIEDNPRLIFISSSFDATNQFEF